MPSPSRSVWLTVNRRIDIQDALTERPDLTSEDLARDFAVSVRVIERDLAELRKAGYSC